MDRDAAASLDARAGTGGASGSNADGPSDANVEAGDGSGDGCAALDVAIPAQAALAAYAVAANQLQARARSVEGKFLAVCNAINADLNLDTTRVSTTEACAVLRARVDAAVALPLLRCSRSALRNRWQAYTDLPRSSQQARTSFRSSAAP